MEYKERLQSLQMLNRLSIPAVKRLSELIFCGNDNIALQAIKLVLDRVYGKPKEQINIQAEHVFDVRAEIRAALLGQSLSAQQGMESSSHQPFLDAEITQEVLPQAQSTQPQALSTAETATGTATGTAMEQWGAYRPDRADVQYLHDVWGTFRKEANKHAQQKASSLAAKNKAERKAAKEAERERLRRKKEMEKRRREYRLQKKKDKQRTRKKTA